LSVASVLLVLLPSNILKPWLKRLLLLAVGCAFCGYVCACRKNAEGRTIAGRMVLLWGRRGSV
jgi:hypothetical protein